MRDSKHYGITSLEGKEAATACPTIRKFINPAVYVESSAKEMAANFRAASSSSFKVKKCVCSTDQETCPCHPDKGAPKVVSKKISPFSSKSSVKTDSGYSGDTALERDDLRLSLTSLSASPCEEEARRKVFQEWLLKKKKEQLLRQLQEEKMERARELERLKKLEQERECFRKWLLNKKREEEKRKLERQRREEEERIRSARPERDPEEKERHMKAWLMRKEKEKLEKKLREKVDELKAAEEKQRRLEENAKAYQEWLKSSKYKPKPIPLNRGIDSLKSLTSVTFVNPTPWVPNIDQPPIDF